MMLEACLTFILIVWGYRTGELLAMTKLKFATLLLWLLAVKFVLVSHGN